MNNMDLRKTAKEKGVCFWQIATELGISEPTMSRRLRLELAEQDKKHIFSIIDKLSSKSETH